MENSTDGITTDPSRNRGDDINVAATIVSAVLLLSLFAAYFFFG